MLVETSANWHPGDSASEASLDSGPQPRRHPSCRSVHQYICWPKSSPKNHRDKGGIRGVFWVNDGGQGRFLCVFKMMRKNLSELDLYRKVQMSCVFFGCVGPIHYKTCLREAYASLRGVKGSLRGGVLLGVTRVVTRELFCQQIWRSQLWSNFCLAFCGFISLSLGINDHLKNVGFPTTIFHQTWAWTTISYSIWSWLPRWHL